MTILDTLYKQLDAQCAEITQGPAIVRVSAPCDNVAPLDWLAQTQDVVQVYWRSRDGYCEIAASGAADTICAGTDTIQRVMQRLASAPEGTRYYGGLRFEPSGAIEPQWQPFGTAQFVLPRVELVRENGHTTLTCQRFISEAKADDVDRYTSRLQSSSSLPCDRRPISSQRNRPDANGWKTSVDAALSAFEPGLFEKVVLARETMLAPLACATPIAALNRLIRDTQHSFYYLFQPEEGATLIGASPERLYRRTGARIETEALAGTRPRGMTPKEDAALAEDLLNSAKERHEQGLVTAYLRQALEQLCSKVETDDTPYIFELHNGRHLRTDLCGTLKDLVSDDSILGALHPTPALGGTPRDRALDFIREYEPFDRGWYGGPLGWLSTDRAEFAVVIRSALLTRNTARIYAGAGIVPGSEPGDEWSELDAKCATLLDVLNDFK